MKTVFADTAYYLAFLNVHDELHGRSAEFTTSFDGQLLTTTWVLTEVADALSRPAFRSTVVDFVRAIQTDPQVTIVPADQELFDRGFDLFARRPDKDWSLTDCISFLVMEELGLKEAATLDRHFVQAGFDVLI